MAEVKSCVISATQNYSYGGSDSTMSSILDPPLDAHSSASPITCITDRPSTRVSYETSIVTLLD